MNKNKRFLIGLASAGIVGGATFGFAASLGTVSSTNLGAGNTVTASCDSSGIDISYTTTYNAAGNTGAGFYDLDTVELANVDAACDGQTIDVTVSDAGASISTGTVAADGSGSASVDVTDVEAELVDGIHVVISG